MQTNTDHIIRDCCEAEVAEFGKPDLDQAVDAAIAAAKGK